MDGGGPAATSRPEGAGRSACPVCGAPGTGRYCADCGRLRRTRLPALGELLTDVRRDVLGLEDRFAATLRAVFLRPGEVTDAYRRGEGSRYVSPVRLYLLASALFFAVGLASEEVLALPGLELTVGTVRTPMEVPVFLSVPVWALWLRRVLAPSHRPYSECLLFALCLQAAVFLIAAPARLALPATLEPAPGSLFLVWGVARAAKSLWGRTGWSRLWRSAAAVAAYPFVVVLTYGAVVAVEFAVRWAMGTLPA